MSCCFKKINFPFLSLAQEKKILRKKIISCEQVKIMEIEMKTLIMIADWSAEIIKSPWWYKTANLISKEIIFLMSITLS